jgi:hypothetical protein
MRRIIVGLAVVLCVMTGAFAQDLEKESTCDDAAMATFLEELTALIGTQTDYKTPFEFLDAIALAVETQRFTCSGMVLSGVPVEGSSKVILGPIKIPDGLYRVVMTSPDDILIQFTKLSGDCFYSNFFAEGDATNGSEELLETEDDCEVLIEVDADAEWEFRFIPVGN